MNKRLVGIIVMFVFLSVIALLATELFAYSVNIKNEGGQVGQLKYGVAVDAQVFRHLDKGAGVVCWTSDKGISCLPIGSTLLGWGK